MKFDKKTGLLFIALVLVVFIGIIMVNKKVEGFTQCNDKQRTQIREAYKKDITPKPFKHLVLGGGPNMKKLSKEKGYDKFINKDGTLTELGESCIKPLIEDTMGKLGIKEKTKTTTPYVPTTTPYVPTPYVPTPYVPTTTPYVPTTTPNFEKVVNDIGKNMIKKWPK